MELAALSLSSFRRIFSFLLLNTRIITFLSNDLITTDSSLYPFEILYEDLMTRRHEYSNIREYFRNIYDYIRYERRDEAYIHVT